MEASAQCCLGAASAFILREPTKPATGADYTHPFKAGRRLYGIPQLHGMPPKSDLLDLSRLNVEFAGGAQDTVQTIYIRPDRRKIAGPPRKIPVQSTWHREIELGHGGGGRVYLEKCTECTHDNVQGQVGQLRAVKRLLKQPKVDYSRELEAVALFSHERVRRFDALHRQTFN